MFDELFVGVAAVIVAALFYMFAGQRMGIPGLIVAIALVGFGFWMMYRQAT